MRLAYSLDLKSDRRTITGFGATEAVHRGALGGLALRRAEEVGVLVGLEVRQAHDHRRRRHRGGDGGDALGEAVDVELHRPGVAGDARVDLLPGRRVLPVVLE